MGQPGLQTLINADATEFLAKCWPNQFFFREGPGERLAGLTDYRFEDLVKMECDYAIAYRAREGRTVRMRVSKGQETTLYESGFTIHFFNLKCPAMDIWLRAIEKDLGLVPGAVRVSSYASRQDEGLTTHFDGSENFICQARGLKRWQVAENIHVRYPTFGYVLGEQLQPGNLLEAPAGFPEEITTPSQTLELRPGSVMYLPRGMWHTTKTIETESLHFNIRVGLGLPLWRDVIEYVLRNGSGSSFDDLRAPITPLFNPEGIITEAVQEELKKKISELAVAVSGMGKPLQREALLQFILRSRRLI